MTNTIVATVISPDGTTRDFTDYDAALAHARIEHDASGGVFVVRDLREPPQPRRPTKSAVAKRSDSGPPRSHA